MSKKRVVKKISLCEALVSIMTVSFVDQFRDVGGFWSKDGGDAGKIRDMIRSESAGTTFSLSPNINHAESLFSNTGYMVVNALLLAMSISTTLDAPTRIHLFDSEAVGSDYEACKLTWPAYLYASLSMICTVLFGTSLSTSLLNNILVNIMDDDTLLKFVDAFSFILKLPLMFLQISMFGWFASMELYCHFAYTNTFGIFIDVMSNFLIGLVFYLYAVAVRDMHNYTVDRENSRKMPLPAKKDVKSTAMAVSSQSLEISTDCAGDDVK